jgi:hypothetical protein
VSLPWSRTVQLQVEPDRLMASLETGWRPRKRVAASFPALAALDDGDDVDEGIPLAGERFQAALQELELAGPLRGARCSVEVADSLVHFDVAEGDFEVQGDRQLQMIATACIAELLGETAGSYEVRWSLQTGGRHLLIAGVPRSIIAPLATMADRQASRLQSIQPRFVKQWNAFARSRRAGAALFAVASGAHVVVACVVRGAICAISAGQVASAATVGTVEPDPTAAPPQPAPSLDERVARLLASLGIEPSEGAEFVLVTRDPSAIAASPRWKLVQPSDATP